MIVSNFHSKLSDLLDELEDAAWNRKDYMVRVIRAQISDLVDKEKSDESEPKESPSGLREDPTGNGR